MGDGGPKRPEYVPKTPEQKLGYLVEECGEVLAAAGKTIRWGWESSNPELPPEQRETNAEWLARELLDLDVAVGMVLEQLGKPRAPRQRDVAPPDPSPWCPQHGEQPLECACDDEGAERPTSGIVAIARALQERAHAWEPTACLVGNVTAQQVRDLCEYVLMAAEPELMRAHFEGPRMDVEVRHAAVKHLAASLLDTLGDAPNFIELELTAEGPPPVALLVTIQRWGRSGKSPGTVAREAREDAASLRATILRLIAFWSADDHACFGGDGDAVRMLQLLLDGKLEALDDELFTGDIDLARAELRNAGLDPDEVGRRGEATARASLGLDDGWRNGEPPTCHCARLPRPHPFARRACTGLVPEGGAHG